MSVYVGFKIGKAKEHKAYTSEYYCGGCGYPVSDHDSYCAKCGGAFRKEDADERTCKNISENPNDFYCSECTAFVRGTMVDDLYCCHPIGKVISHCPNCNSKVVR